MHVHTSAIDAVVFGALFLIMGFLTRVVAGKYADRPLGQALAFIH